MGRSLTAALCACSRTFSHTSRASRSSLSLLLQLGAHVISPIERRRRTGRLRTYFASSIRPCACRTVPGPKGVLTKQASCRMAARSGQPIFQPTFPEHAEGIRYEWLHTSHGTWLGSRAERKWVQRCQTRAGPRAARAIRAEMTAASFDYIEVGDWHMAQHDET